MAWFAWVCSLRELCCLHFAKCQELVRNFGYVLYRVTFRLLHACSLFGEMAPLSTRRILVFLAEKVTSAGPRGPDEWKKYEGVQRYSFGTRGCRVKGLHERGEENKKQAQTCRASLNVSLQHWTCINQNSYDANNLKSAASLCFVKRKLHFARIIARFLPSFVSDPLDPSRHHQPCTCSHRSITLCIAIEKLLSALRTQNFKMKLNIYGLFTFHLLFLHLRSHHHYSI